MSLKIRPEWDLDDPADIKVNRDGSVTFKGPVGDVFLPQDYFSMLKISDGIGIDIDDKNAWFLGDFQNGFVILNYYGASRINNVMHGTWGYFDNDEHGKPLLPEGFIRIGISAPHHLDMTKGEFDVLLCCLKDHHDYGKVFVWPRSDDPWMEGTNTIGLGFVADSFTEFMNNLTAQENL